MDHTDYADYADYYAILGIDPSCPADEIARAYRRLARQYHPDVNPHDADAARTFRSINEAYLVLSDPEKRAQYDLQLAASGPSWPHESSPAGPWRDERLTSHQQGGYAQQEDAQWAGEDPGVLLEQAVDEFAGVLQKALRDFGAELDSLSRTVRPTPPHRLGPRRAPPSPPRPGRRSAGGRPPRNGQPPRNGRAPGR